MVTTAGSGWAVPFHAVRLERHGDVDTAIAAFGELDEELRQLRGEVRVRENNS